MTARKFRRDSGQSLVELILVTPLLLLIVLNVVNLGYFFIVGVNLAASPRAGVEFAILGFSTPGSLALASAGPPTSTSSVSYLVQQDMTGAVYNPTSANVQICSPTILSGGSGLNNAGTANQRANCVTCTGSSCGSAGVGSPAPNADPESPLFILGQVKIDYTVRPLIPGTPFGLALLALPTCNASGGFVTCGFTRQVSMRVMN